MFNPVLKKKNPAGLGWVVALRRRLPLRCPWFPGFVRMRATSCAGGKLENAINEIVCRGRRGAPSTHAGAKADHRLVLPALRSLKTWRVPLAAKVGVAEARAILLQDQPKFV